MKTLEELKETPNLCIKGRLTANGAEDFQMYHGFVEWYGFRGSVVFGYNEGGLMEHVSISSYRKRQLPSWDDMCRLKKMFFRDDEMVVQIHPEAERYLHGVNGLGNVLHLWRPKNGDWSILNHPEMWD